MVWHLKAPINFNRIICAIIVAIIIKKVIGTGPDVGNHMHHLIATGNLTSKSGLGLQQVCEEGCCNIVFILCSLNYSNRTVTTK